MDLFFKLISTIYFRPYVFFFFIIFFLSARYTIGLKRTIIFTLLSWFIAFIAEFSSTRIGIPFGYYYYIESTRHKEIWITNIPLMDSLSFTFLSYASYSMALSFLLPNRKNNIDFHLSFPVLILSVLFFVLLDIVIDPLALRGDRWFLGKIFDYPYPGIYFGVPLSNFLGWGVVGFMIIYLFQRIDTLLFKDDKNRWNVIKPNRLLYYPGVILYYTVLAFNLFMTFYIGENLLGIVGIFIHLPILIFFFFRLFYGSYVNSLTIKN